MKHWMKKNKEAKVPYSLVIFGVKKKMADTVIYIISKLFSDPKYSCGTKRRRGTFTKIRRENTPNVAIVYHFKSLY